MQLMSDNGFSPQEILIFTNGSKTGLEDGTREVGCAVVIPSLGKEFKFKLNSLSSFYRRLPIAEVITMNSAMDIVLSEKLNSINICSDLLSALTKLKTSLLSVFPFVRSDLDPSLMDLLLKVTRLFANDIHGLLGILLIKGLKAMGWQTPVQKAQLRLVCSNL